MSDSASLIQEVSNEVRRDRLFGLFRKYGWIGIAVIVLLVGGAAYNEWSRAQARATAQAHGDAILAALEANDSATRKTALQGIADTDRTRFVVDLLIAAEALEAGDRAAAADALDAIAMDAGQPAIYRDLARLKQAILTADDTPPATRIAVLQPLTDPGSAFRVLAEEQIALAEIENGDRDAALNRLRAILDDAGATAGLRRRVSRLIVALGAEIAPG